MGRAFSSPAGAAALALGLLLILPAWTPARADDDADGPGHVVDAWTPGTEDDASARALNGAYSGFGAETSGGEGRPVFAVTSLADAGIGTLRSVLESVGRLGGGRVVFNVGGDVVLRAELVIPANTTIDGLSAPAPGVTLWGDRLGTGGGVLEINASNVIVRGLRIRNAINDGIHIAAKPGRSIGRIVVDHCSITNSGDGGIDVTGADGALVRDVTLSWNYLAGNGSACTTKGWCGGGSLVKYGVTRLSAHGNFWDKNLRRNPSIDGAAVDGGTLADVRGNVVRGYVENGTQLRNGARGNVVGNFFEGDRPLLTDGASVFAAANAGASSESVAQPFDVAAPLAIVTREAVVASTGALPTDALDSAYRDTLATYDDVKNAVAAAGSLGGDFGAAATAPVDAATLASARAELRAARTARSRGRRHETIAGYASVLAFLDGARGVYARAAEAVMADAALALSQLAAADAPAARAYATIALAHAARSGDATRERRARHRLQRLPG